VVAGYSLEGRPSPAKIDFPCTGVPPPKKLKFTFARYFRDGYLAVERESCRYQAALRAAKVYNTACGTFSKAFLVIPTESYHLSTGRIEAFALNCDCSNEGWWFTDKGNDVKTRLIRKSFTVDGSFLSKCQSPSKLRTIMPLENRFSVRKFIFNRSYRRTIFVNIWNENILAYRSGM
jgi:hypothetical protein